MTTLTNDTTIINKVINHTQELLNDWYKEVKKVYEVNGAAIIYFNENNMFVEYVEDGIKKTWSMCFYPEYIENGINWVFNCWMEVR